MRLHPTAPPSPDVAIALLLNDERAALAIRAASLRRAESGALAAGHIDRADRCARARHLVARARDVLDYESDPS